MKKELFWAVFRRCILFGAVATALFWFGYSYWSGNEIPSTDQISLFGYSFELPIDINRFMDIAAVPILFFLIVLCLVSGSGATWGVIAGGVASFFVLLDANPVSGGSVRYFIHAFWITDLVAFVCVCILLMSDDDNEFKINMETFFRMQLGYGVGLSIAFVCYPFVLTFAAAIVLSVASVLVFLIPMICVLILGWLLGSEFWDEEEEDAKEIRSRT